jgi:hypothetical protein
MDLALIQFWVWFTFWFLQEPERAAPKTDWETNQKPSLKCRTSQQSVKPMLGSYLLWLLRTVLVSKNQTRSNFRNKKRIQNMILILYITRPTNRFLILFSRGIGMRTGTQIFEKKQNKMWLELRAHLPLVSVSEAGSDFQKQNRN